MKKNFRTWGVGLLMFAAFLVTGCAGSEASSVGAYNNKIVVIQQDMLQRAQDSAKFLSGQDLDASRAASEMSNVLADVQKTYDEFKALQVPKGGEAIAAAMKNFFDVEVEGLNNLIVNLRSFVGKEKDGQAVNNLMKVVDDFSKKENDALVNFNDVQKQTADKYGKKVETN